jgi:hypothetical protein
MWDYNEKADVASNIRTVCVSCASALIESANDVGLWVPVGVNTRDNSIIYLMRERREDAWKNPHLHPKKKAKSR